MSTTKRHPVRSLLSLFLAILVLISTTGFSVDFHICQGSIASFAINGEAKACSSMSLEEKQVLNSEKRQDESGQERVEKKPCCLNETVIHSVKEQLRSPEVNNPVCLETTLAPAQVELNNTQYHEVLTSIIPKVFPIPWKLNTQVLHQCFLI